MWTGSTDIGARIVVVRKLCRRTMSDGLHLRFEQDGTLKFADLPMVFINNLERIINN